MRASLLIAAIGQSLAFLWVFFSPLLSLREVTASPAQDTAVAARLTASPHRNVTASAAMTISVFAAAAGGHRRGDGSMFAIVPFPAVPGAGPPGVSMAPSIVLAPGMSRASAIDGAIVTPGTVPPRKPEPGPARPRQSGRTLPRH